MYVWMHSYRNGGEGGGRDRRRRRRRERGRREMGRREMGRRRRERGRKEMGKRRRGRKGKGEDESHTGCSGGVSVPCRAARVEGCTSPEARMS